MKKERVDVLLVARGLAETRARAQALLLAGRVFSGEQRVDKPGSTLPLDAPLAVRGGDNPYVSRGGLKLAGALAAFAPARDMDWLWYVGDRMPDRLPAGAVVTWRGEGTLVARLAKPAAPR